MNYSFGTSRSTRNDFYQIPVYAAEKRVRLDISKSRLGLTAKPFFGILWKTQTLELHTPSLLQPTFAKSPQR